MASSAVNLDGLVSVGYAFALNAAFGLSFLAWFGVLRQSTSLAGKWFAPRRLFDERSEKRGGRLAPASPLSWAWLVPLMRLTEDELIAQAGLDAVVFLRFFRLCAHLFAGLACVLLPMLLPVFVTADTRGTRSSWATAVSLANLPPGSLQLWWPLLGAYVTTGAALVLMRREYRHVAALRLRELCRRDAAPEAYALLCLDVPSHQDSFRSRALAAPSPPKRRTSGTEPAQSATARRAASLAQLAVRTGAALLFGHTVTRPDAGATAAAVEAELERLHPGAGVKAVPVPHLPPVQAAMAAWRDAVARARDAVRRAEAVEEPLQPSPTESLESPLLPLGERDTAPLRPLSSASQWRLRRRPSASEAEAAARAAGLARARLVRAQAAAAALPSHAAFLVFRSRRTAAAVAQVLLYPNPLHWRLELAPAPDEVHWQNVRLRWWERSVRRLAANIASFLIITFFLLPVGAISTLSIVRLRDALPLIGNHYERAIEGYLPGATLALALTLVPFAFQFLAMRQGCHSVSQTDREVAARVFELLILDAFLGTTVTTTVVRLLTQLPSESITDIIKLLGSTVPDQAPFFVTFIFVRALAGLPLELSRLVPMCRTALRALLDQPDVWAPGPMPYGRQVPSALLISALGLIYAPISPTLLPFVALFFTIGCAVWRYQVLFVYTRAYESNGAWWPHMADRLLLSLAIGHGTLLAVFALKLSNRSAYKGARGLSATLLAGPALLPLLLAVYYANRHWHERYGAVFQRIPLSCAAEMGDGADGMAHERAYVAPCMRSPEEVEAEEPDLFLLPPPYYALARPDPVEEPEASLAAEAPHTSEPDEMA